jgi:hypothetical protein
MATFQLFFFSVQVTGGGIPTGPDPENRVVYQDTGSPGEPVSSGFQGGKNKLDDSSRLDIVEIARVA